MKPTLEVRDHFLSKENFQIRPYHIEGVLKTFPIPENLDSYYKSSRYLSHAADEEKNLENLAYTFVQQINLKLKKVILKKFAAPGALVLDYGCGTGDFLKFISKDYIVKGFEPNTKAAGKAAVKIGYSHMITSLEDIEDRSLDVITLWHVLEHIPQPEIFLQKLQTKLKSNGSIIIAVPNFLSDDAKKYKEFWAAWDVPRHLYHFSKEGMKNLVHLFLPCFKIEKIYPLPFDAIYISLLSEKYQKKRPNIISGVLNGLISNFKALKSSQFSSLVYCIRKNEIFKI